MKKIITQYILCVSLVLFSLSFQNYFNIYNFNTSNVKNNISYLSHDDLKGRLAGTLENKMAEKFVKDTFIKNNLIPFEGSYVQPFTIKYPKALDNKPSLLVIDDNNNIVEEFNYGVDYKEDFINFKVNETTFDKSHIKSSNENTLIIKNDTASIVFYATDSDDINFRSSFTTYSPFDLYIKIKMDELKNLNNFLDIGKSIYVYIPYEISETNVNNVMGYIKGSDSKKSPIILSCHFDHVGQDILGNVYNGALDNASGTAFLLEMINYIQKLGKPDRDILFVAFNAEEFGCVGSNEFLNKYKDKILESKLYNFDMIGSLEGVPLCIIGGDKDTKETALIKDLTKIFEEEKIYFNYLFENASDHEGFRRNNIEAVTLSDYDLSRIHTLDDNVEHIDEAAIKRCFNVISQELIRNYYKYNPLIYYNKQVFIVSILGVFLFSYLYRKHEN
ncbi:MAG: Zn-dependent exopeptidase M28 [Clostridium argentinense]|uniref:Zn-dependent exopeptidase M28 n=1 Tax=Clostridium faecium TaxID=2762223 RepID=A0ABR8YVM6_9CLOT|nr:MULTISPECIES: M28 family metallopeptidase [Clostridium]MBD8048332.1 Zn-dependent exopeptidase M28 [Clostridium faecium]MBS5824335.1 Zn-dependent exopeptidase M28 [Clostridium argentinense]MDU1350687.1 M28 family metallopeptidase [Clostridium argentinense]